MNHLDQAKWRRFMLLSGVVIGLALAGFGALQKQGKNQNNLPPGAIAMVNATPILRADFVRALTAVSAGKRNPVTKDDEAAILQRLIEEELLVQHALKLGMIETDTGLRNSLVGALTRDVIARSRAKVIPANALRKFYQKNQQHFIRGSRYFVIALYFNLDASAQIAAFDTALNEKISQTDLLQKFAANIAPTPQGLVPKQKLLDYLGPEPVQVLDRLAIGQWSEPISTTSGHWRIFVNNRTKASAPTWQEIKPMVENAYLDDRDTRALRAYIDRLKEQAEISLSPATSP